MIEERLPSQWADRNKIAFRAFRQVRSLLDLVLGEGQWKTETRPRADGSPMTWLVPVTGPGERAT